MWQRYSRGNKTQPRSPAARLARLFRTAGVFLAKDNMSQALKTFRVGESLAQILGDEEKLALFRQEIARCERASMQ